jgi:predicted esterase
VPANNAARLADILREAGAEVAVRWTDGGHRLSAEDVAGAREWLARIFTPQPVDAPGGRQMDSIQT